MRLLFIIALIVLLPIVSLSENSITFAFTTDFLSQLEPVYSENDSSTLGGAARLSTAVKNLRLTSDRFLLFDTGNHFAGFNYMYFGGEPEVELMNYVRYDAMAVGATELSMGEDLFDNWARMANFHILLSNLIAPPQCKTCRHITSYTTIERSGLIVGIFALLPSDIELYARLSKNVEIDREVSFVTNDIIEILLDKCDIIVLLSQLDVQSNIKLADEFCEIDLIICNDWSVFPDEPIVIKNEIGCNTIIGCAGKRGTRLGVLNTTWDDDGNLIEFEWNPVLLDESIPLEPTAHEIVENYVSQFPKPQAIGRTAVELDGRDIVLRGAESNLGNLVADAMLDAFPEADIALLPGASIWGQRIIPPGPITDRDVLDILPYQERAVIVSLEGKTLLDLLERSACCMDQRFGGFFQIAGATVTIDTSRKAQTLEEDYSDVETSGSRITKLRIDGEKLDNEAFYNVVTTDFIANGGFRYFWFEKAEVYRGMTLPDLVIDYIRKKSPVAPQVEGRIHVIP